MWLFDSSFAPAYVKSVLFIKLEHSELDKQSIISLSLYYHHETELIAHLSKIT